jgi:hypothetical protein
VKADAGSSKAFSYTLMITFLLERQLFWLLGYCPESCSSRARHEQDHPEYRIIPSKVGERIGGGDFIGNYSA